MNGQLLEKLEASVDAAIELVELLQMQVEELEDKNSALMTDNQALKTRQQQWEQSLAALLHKFETASFNQEVNKATKILETEEAPA